MNPLIPQYGAAALPNVVPSILARLGVPDMTAVLGLPGARRVCLLLVDGLGWKSLRSREAEAPFLSSLVSEGEPITAGFPATTATSIAALGTGLPPGEHGFVGYSFAAADNLMLNHWWNVPLYVTSRGLTTSLIPHDSGRNFHIDSDFQAHRLQITTADGQLRSLILEPQTVANFYNHVLNHLNDLGCTTRSWPMPVEIEDAIPFDEDNTHVSYDRDHVQRYWRTLIRIDRVMHVFRSRFLGKASPVHLWWADSGACSSTSYKPRTRPRQTTPDGRDQRWSEPDDERWFSCPIRESGRSYGKGELNDGHAP